METALSRLELLIGSENTATLKAKKVVIFGIGGVGGYVCEALVRSGIEHFILVDNDVVNITNLNRQIIATYKTLGQYKVEAMKDRILDINPSCDVTLIKKFMLKEDIESFSFDGVDYIIDAIDTITSKIALVEMANKNNIRIISSMGTGNKMNPAMLEVSDIYKTSVCPLAKVMRHELKKRNINNLKVVYSKEEPLKVSSSSERKVTPGSNSFVPSTAGLIIASEVIKDLIK